MYVMKKQKSNFIKKNSNRKDGKKKKNTLTRQQVIDSSAGELFEQALVGHAQFHTGVICGAKPTLFLVAELCTG